jgi:hypothetical protein
VPGRQEQKVAKLLQTLGNIAAGLIESAREEEK